MASTPPPSSSPAKTPPNTKRSPPTTSTSTAPSPPPSPSTSIPCSAPTGRSAACRSVEGDLYRSIIAESSNATLIAALLSDSPAAKLLARVQRQIAAFERTWYRANAELRRAREQAEPAFDRTVEHYLDFLSARPAPGELASFRQSAGNGRPDSPAAPSATPNWPPTDAKTGRPAFFVG